MNPLDANIHVGLAGTYLQMNQFDDAVESFERAIELGYFYEAGCYYNIGNAHRRAGNYRQAISALQRAKSLGFSEDTCDDAIRRCQEQLR